jgi:hypothetical protein
MDNLQVDEEKSSNLNNTARPGQGSLTKMENFDPPYIEQPKPELDSETKEEDAENPKLNRDYS